MPVKEETTQEDMNAAQPDATDSEEALNLAQPDAKKVEDKIAKETSPFAADSPKLPDHLNLQAYDDCGVEGRQPHVKGGHVYTFPKEKVNAGARGRSVAFSPNGVLRVQYENLNPEEPYWLVVVYATEKDQGRRQRLVAGDRVLHPARDLPMGRAEKLAMQVPGEAIVDGVLTLDFERVEGPNVTVSEVELWSPESAKHAFYLQPWPRSDGRLKARLTDLRHWPVVGANVRVNGQASTQTDENGIFQLDMKDAGLSVEDGVVELQVDHEQLQADFRREMSDFLFVYQPYRPEADSVTGIKAARFSLDGPWKARLSGEAPGKGRKFTVPGQLLQQGFDVTPESTFIIEKEFKAPTDWEGKRVFLRLEAVHGKGQYFLNDQPLGESDLLYTPVEFDVSEHFLPGQANQITLRLSTDPALLADRLASSSAYAHHNPGGIHRTVYLFALPKQHISELNVQAKVSDDFQSGEVELALSVQAEESEALKAQVKLRDPLGREVELAQDTFSLAAGEMTVLSIPVDNPKLWSNETPYLYELELTLADSAPLERLHRKLGFRHLQTQGGQLLVNGKPVKLFGFNRHETDHLTGRANTARHAYEDARLFKEANCNFIRTSHYPPTREFMQACDELGLFVEVEAPFCWTHQWTEENDPAAARAFLEPTAAMLDWHQWHPSAIIWSLGNESGWYHDRPGIPANYGLTNAYLQENDRTRLTLFNNSWANDDGLCDIGVLHYPNPNDIDAGLINPEDPRPIQIDEWLHIMCYNTEELDADPGIREEWAHGLTRFARSDGLELWDRDSIHNRLRRSNRYLGITVWAGIDELFELPNGEKHGYGNWGIIDKERRKKPEWWHVRTMYSPIWLPQRQADYVQESGLVRVAIENRHSFTNMEAFTIHWQAGKKKGQLPCPSIAPLEKGVAQWSIPSNLIPGSILKLDFVDKQGKSHSTWGIDLGTRPQSRIFPPQAGTPQWSRSGEFIKIQGNNFTMKVNTKDGTIEGIALKSLPALHLTQVQRATRFNQALPHYEVLPNGKTREIESLVVKEEEKCLLLTLKDRYDEFEGTVQFRIDGLGECEVYFAYQYTGEPREVREYGVRLDLTPECQKLQWKRRGVWGAYPSDHIGRLEGIVEAFPAALPTPLPWSLEGDKRGTRDFRSTKYRIYEASLRDPKGNGIQMNANGQINIRAEMAEKKVLLHLLKFETPGAIQPQDKVAGTFHFSLTNRP